LRNGCAGVLRRIFNSSALLNWFNIVNKKNYYPRLCAISEGRKKMRKLLALAVILLASVVSANANQITYSDSVAGLFDLVADRDLLIPQFDSSLGTLNSVSIAVETGLQASLGFENKNPTSGGTFYVYTYFTFDPANEYTRARVDLSFNDAVILTSGYSDAKKYTLTNISAYDGTTDYAGTSGRILGTFGDADNQSFFYDSALAEFIGSGNLTFGVLSDAYTTLSWSGGSSDVRIATTGQAGVTVVYDFTPIPEPTTMCILAIGSLVFLRKRK